MIIYTYREKGLGDNVTQQMLAHTLNGFVACESVVSCRAAATTGEEVIMILGATAEEDQQKLQKDEEL